MLSEYRQALRLFSRNARSYVIFNLFVGLYYNGLFLVLLNLFLLRLGYGLDRIGLINALGWASVLVCSVPAGMCGTRWGTRQALVAGSILYTLGVGLCPLAMFAPLHLRTAWLLATNVIAGAGGALFLVNGNPFLMDATSPRERNHAFSLVMALGPFAAFAGGLIGGLLPGLWATALRVTLDEPAPYGYSLLAGTALLLPGIAVLLGTHDLRAQAKPAAGLATASAAAPEVSLHSGGQAAPYGLIGVMMLVGLLRVAGESAARTFFNVHLDASLGASTALIGVLGAVAQLGSGVAPLVAPLLMARWGSVRTTVWGALGLSVSLLPLALISHWLAAGLGLVGVLGLAGIARTAFTVYTQESVIPQWRPAMSAATNMAVGASTAIVAFGGGYMIQALGYPAFFASGAGLTAAGAVLLAAYVRLRREEGIRFAV